jgi:hypothetical protein
LNPRNQVVAHLKDSDLWEVVIGREIDIFIKKR